MFLRLPPGLPGTTAKAPPIAPPPQPVRRQPVAGPQQHRPVGKHHNPARQRPQPQQAGAVLQQPTVLQQADMDNDYIDAYDCYNLTLETNVLHLAVNEDKKESQLQQELMLDHAVLLPSYHYHDNIGAVRQARGTYCHEEGVGQTTTKRHVRRM